MKRHLLLLSGFLFVALIFFSCKKEISEEGKGTSANSELISKINQWLDDQKPSGKATQSANVDLLKANLDFPVMRIEQSAGNEKIVIVPVKKGLAESKNIDRKATPNLVLILDNTQNIRKGNIVLYFPANGQAQSKVPDNTFYEILNTGKPDCDAKFTYLDVTGRKLHELEYENENLKAFSNFKKPANSGSSSRATNCVDWYWVTTYYDSDGLVIGQDWEYVGTTCQGEDCEDPYLAMLCPMSNNEGSGGTAEYEEEKRKTAIYEWIVQHIPSQVGGGVVFQVDHLVAKFFKNHPENNHFVGGGSSSINLYSNSWGENGTVSYSNTTASVTVNSNTQITTASSGRITFPNTIFVDYTGSKSVSLSECNWPQ